MPSRFNEPPRKIDHEKIKSLVTELLTALGEDPNREGLKETPRRIANFAVLVRHIHCLYC